MNEVWIVTVYDSVLGEHHVLGAAGNINTAQHVIAKIHNNGTPLDWDETVTGFWEAESNDKSYLVQRITVLDEKPLSWLHPNSPGVRTISG